MNSNLALLLAFGIGVIAGLRAMTAPAVTAWAAHLGRLNLLGSPLDSWDPNGGRDLHPGGIGRTHQRPVAENSAAHPAWPADRSHRNGWTFWSVRRARRRPSTMARRGARRHRRSAGTFAGYNARVGLVRSLHVPDFAVAIPEDLVAIGVGWLLVTRF